MDFSKIGSLSGYMKNMKLQTKWKHKKETNDFQSQSKKSELQRKNEMFKASYMEQREQNQNDNTLSNINNKIAAGADLTPDEMRYLKSKNPIMYQKLMAAEAEEKNYEKELKKCKTKEEVEKLKMNKVSSAMSAINSVKSNPNIPEGTKLAVAQGEMKRLQNLEKIADKFEKSGDYAKLPTEAEKRKAEADIAEAKRAEAEKPYEDKEIITADNNAETDTAEKTEFTDDDKQIKPNEAIKETKAEAGNVASEDKMTTIEAELTPEAQKLKRSKAKSAYVLAERDFSPILLQKN